VEPQRLLWGQGSAGGQWGVSGHGRGRSRDPCDRQWPNELLINLKMAATFSLIVNYPPRQLSKLPAIVVSHGCQRISLSQTACRVFPPPTFGSRKYLKHLPAH